MLLTLALLLTLGATHVAASPPALAGDRRRLAACCPADFPFCLRNGDCATGPFFTAGNSIWGAPTADLLRKKKFSRRALCTPRRTCRGQGQGRKEGQSAKGCGIGRMGSVVTFLVS